MYRLFRGYEEAVRRSVAIANRCRFSLDELTYDYPDEPYAPYATPQEALIAHTWEGAAHEYPKGVPDKVKAQIEYELKLIEETRFFFAGVWAAWMFFAAGDAVAQLRWGLPAAVMLLMAVMIKMAIWPTVQTNRILRELKLIQLQLARRTGQAETPETTAD